MNLHEFLELNKYPARDRKQFIEAFNSFLMTDDIRPYYAAILRSNIQSITKIQGDIENFFKIFSQILPKEKWIELRSWSHIWDELTTKPIFNQGSKRRTNYSYNLFDGISREVFLLPKLQEQADNIKKFVLNCGKQILDKERDHGLNSALADAMHFYEYKHYIDKCREIHTEASTLFITHLANEKEFCYEISNKQFEHYLDYFEKKINVYLKIEEGYNENKKQAEETIKTIKKCLTYLHVNSHDNLLERIKQYINYWKQEIPRIYSRQNDIQQIDNFNKKFPNEKFPGEVVYRYVSEDEASSLKKCPKFFQHKEKSMEREKWFFYEGGCPGANVTHNYLCTIHLKKGALELLKKLQKPDGIFAAIVKKENEPKCFGIHEDMLPFFNNMICGVEVKQKSEPYPKNKCHPK